MDTLNTEAVMQTAYGYVHLLQQTRVFLTQGFRFCYFRHLALQKPTNTSCIFVQYCDYIVFASFFGKA